MQIKFSPLELGNLPIMRESLWHTESVAQAKSKGFMFVLV
jgi:hypothetical protein